MTPEAFLFLAGFVRASAGIVLTADQIYMLEARLGALLRREGLPSLDALALRLREVKTSPLALDVLEAITTNESSFFRDGRPFEHLRRLLPTLLASRPKQHALRIWSAACAAGQEAYSAAMVAADVVRPACRVEILGTDIAAKVVARAREGLYTQFEVKRGLPMHLLERWLRREADGRWRVTPELRAMTRFETANLLSDCRSFGVFDIIFCRNVLIYFDPPTKTHVLRALAAQLSLDGVLYLGGGETALGLTDRLKPVEGERGVYRLAQRTANHD